MPADHHPPAQQTTKVSAGLCRSGRPCFVEAAPTIGADFTRDNLGCIRLQEMGAPGAAATFVWNILIKRHRLWGCFGAAPQADLSCRKQAHLHLQSPAPVIDTLRSFRRDSAWPVVPTRNYLTTIFFNDLSSQSNPKKRRVLIRSIEVLDQITLFLIGQSKAEIAVIVLLLRKTSIGSTPPARGRSSLRTRRLHPAPGLFL